jgi:endonuclease YncB( thermonuclease family)
MRGAERNCHSLLTLICVLASLEHAAQAQRQKAVVLSIGDGDTLRVQELGRTMTVRLACIDAPEMAQLPWGQKAQQQLQALAPIGSTVELRSKATDRYGR